MEYETFISEFFRTTWLTRKRSIHAQLGEIDSNHTRLDLTIAERATLQAAWQRIMNYRHVFGLNEGAGW
jgi:hypothetical protein